MCLCITKRETLTYDCPHLHVRVYSVFRNYQDRYRTAGERVNIPSAYPVGPWNVIFSVSSAFQSKIPHYVSLPWDGRLSAVPFVWSQTYSSLFILRSQRHVGESSRCAKDWPAPASQRVFCITLTVSVKRDKREKHKINKDIETLYVRNTLIAAFVVFGGWCHSGVLHLVSSVFCKIVK